MSHTLLLPHPRMSWSCLRPLVGLLFISLGFNMWREVVVHGSAQLEFRTAFSISMPKILFFYQHSSNIYGFFSTKIFVHAELVQLICGLDGVPMFYASSSIKVIRGLNSLPAFIIHECIAVRGLLSITDWVHGAITITKTAMTVTIENLCEKGRAADISDVICECSLRNMCMLLWG